MKFKRLLCLILCLTITIFAASYRAPEAQAVGLAIGLGVVIAALAAAGLTYLVTSGTEDDLATVVNSAIGDWLEESGNIVQFPTPNDFYDIISGGSQQDGPNRIIVEPTATQLLLRFFEWLVAEMSVSPGETVQVVNSRSLPLQNGYLHLSEVTLDSWGLPVSDSVVLGDQFVVRDYSSGGETIICTLYNGSYISVKYYSGSGNDRVYTYYFDSGSQTISTSYRAGTVSFLYQLVATSDYQFGVLSSDGSNYRCSWLTVENTAHFLTGLVSSSVDISAQLDSDPAELLPSEDDSLTLTVPGVDADDLQDLSDQIIASAVSGSLSTDGTVSPDQSSDASSILEWLHDIWLAITELPGRISTYFTNVVDAINNLPGNLAQFFTNVVNAIQALPQSIADAVSSAFTLDPELATEITDYFSDKFDWLTPLHDWAADIFSVTPAAPVIYINLQNAGSNYGYDYGGREVALDLSWYAEYKEDVDSLISGFLWLGFLWLLFKRSADIIQGAGMAQNEANEIFVAHDLDDRDHLFRRRKYR